MSLSTKCLHPFIPGATSIPDSRVPEQFMRGNIPSSVAPHTTASSPGFKKLSTPLSYFCMIKELDFWHLFDISICRLLIQICYIKSLAKIARTGVKEGQLYNGRQ